MGRDFGNGGLSWIDQHRARWINMDKPWRNPFPEIHDQFGSIWINLDHSICSKKSAIYSYIHIHSSSMTQPPKVGSLGHGSWWYMVIHFRCQGPELRLDLAAGCLWQRDHEDGWGLGSDEIASLRWLHAHEERWGKRMKLAGSFNL